MRSDLGWRLGAPNVLASSPRLAARLLRGLGAAGAAANARAELERDYSSQVQAEIVARRVRRAVTAGAPLAEPTAITAPWRDTRRVA